jgi:hypothetical protein
MIRQIDFSLEQANIQFRIYIEEAEKSQDNLLNIKNNINYEISWLENKLVFSLRDAYEFIYKNF